MITRYRHADHEDETWGIGWNIFSKSTIEKILGDSGYDLDIVWHDFMMPFAIPPKGDPMRTWTVPIDGEPHVTVNGAMQIIEMRILEIAVKDVPA